MNTSKKSRFLTLIAIALLVIGQLIFGSLSKDVDRQNCVRSLNVQRSKALLYECKYRIFALASMIQLNSELVNADVKSKIELEFDRLEESWKRFREVQKSSGLPDAASANVNVAVKNLAAQIDEWRMLDREPQIQHRFMVTLTKLTEALYDSISTMSVENLNSVQQKNNFDGLSIVLNILTLILVFYLLFECRRREARIG